MPRQWEGTTSSAVLTGGVKTVVPLKCPPRCQLQKLIVVQTAGVAVTFTVNLFSSAAKAAAFAAGTDDLNRVVAEVPSTGAGQLRKFFDTAGEGAYENKDGGPSNKLYYIYAVILPTGVAVNLEYDITLGVLVAPDCE